MVERIHLSTSVRAPDKLDTRKQTSVSGSSFADVLNDVSHAGTGRLTFSAHALRRLDERRITLTPADMSRLEQAVGVAAQKGAQESLFLMDDLAFVVSVPNRTVITAVPRDTSEDTVFTNIDSAILVANRQPLPAL